MRKLGVLLMVALFAAFAASAASPSTPGTNGAILFTQPRCPSAIGHRCTRPPQPCAVDPVTGASFVPALPAEAVLSPDGSRYAYGGFHDGILELLVANADGSSARAVGRTDGAFGPWPAWSPDGSRVAFIGTAPTNPPPLEVADLAAGTVQRLASPAFEPSWAPDGSQLGVVTFTAGVQQVIGAVDAESGAIRFVTSEPGGPTQPADSDPDWSPDSARIAFTHVELGLRSRLERIARDGSDRRVVTDGSSPSWSPDGTRMAFIRDGAVWTVAPDGSSPRQLSEVPDVLDTRPRWLTNAQSAALKAVGNCDTDASENDATYVGGEGIDTFLVRGVRVGVYGGGGDDLFFVWRPSRRGSTLLDGGPGDDDFELYGSANNVIAGDGDDQVDAVLDGLPQQLSAGTGNDRIRGGSGNDVIDGGPGRDSLYGSFGANTIHGGSGNDVVSAYSGSKPQHLFGGPGNDRVVGGGGPDLLYGGTGRDGIVGHGGNDVVHAQDRTRDVIDCGSGRDTVYADRLDAVARNCERVLRR